MKDPKQHMYIYSLAYIYLFFFLHAFKVNFRNTISRVPSILLLFSDTGLGMICYKINVFMLVTSCCKSAVVMAVAIIVTSGTCLVVDHIFKKKPHSILDVFFL